MRVPDKIKSGENFKSAFLRWSNQIVDYLRSAQIVGDHKTVSISQTASGTVIHARAQQKTAASSGSAQAGMFAVSYNAETEKLEVKWDHEEGVAGHIYLNLKHYLIEAADDIEPEEGYLCISIDTNGQNQGFKIVSRNSWPDFPTVVHKITSYDSGTSFAVDVTEPEEVLYPIAEIKKLYDNGGLIDDDGEEDDEEDDEEPEVTELGWSIYQMPIYQPPQLLAFGICDGEDDEEDEEDGAE